MFLFSGYDQQKRSKAPARRNVAELSIAMVWLANSLSSCKNSGILRAQVSE
jgi:hypothetical protein